MTKKLISSRAPTRESNGEQGDRPAGKYRTHHPKTERTLRMAQDNKPPSSLQMHRALARVAGDSLKAGAGTPERENACRAALRAQQAMAAVVRAEAAESNKDMFLLVREDPFADMALLRVANSVFMKKDKTVEA